ncbi:S-adenosylmethionine decarboxylase [Alphaproteobacteria bacterium]|nr:S-adenosylmethionine decarboxylase [Alphaproteobacteria bacterium]
MNFTDNKIKKDNKKNNMPWGKHFIIDMEGCNEVSISNKTHIEKFSYELVSNIKMKAYGEPIIEYFANDSIETAGYSLVQLIETSNITAHFAENSRQVFIDIFSCKDFEESKALQVCNNFFSPKKTYTKIINRGKI